jgi:hypothetical protein
MQLIDSNTNKPWEVDIKPLIARGVRVNQPTAVPGLIPGPGTE